MTDALTELTYLHDKLVLLEGGGCVDEGVGGSRPDTSKSKLGCALGKLSILGKVLVPKRDNRGTTVIVHKHIFPHIYRVWECHNESDVPSLTVAILSLVRKKLEISNADARLFSNSVQLCRLTLQWKIKIRF